jgi:hypothetical protein
MAYKKKKKTLQLATLPTSILGQFTVTEFGRIFVYEMCSTFNAAQNVTLCPEQVGSMIFTNGGTAELLTQSLRHFSMTTFSASLTSLTVLPPQSRDYSCYSNRPILAPPPLLLQKHTVLRAHDVAHSPDL